MKFHIRRIPLLSAGTQKRTAALVAENAIAHLPWVLIELFVLGLMTTWLTVMLMSPIN